MHQGRGKVVTVSDKDTVSKPSACGDQVGPSLSSQAADAKLNVYMCRLDSMRLNFVTTASEIRVLSIELHTAQSVEASN